MIGAAFEHPDDLRIGESPRARTRTRGRSSGPQAEAARIRAKKLHVVLDSVNASGCAGGRMMLDALGCGVTHIYCEMTGIFGHTPEPTAENLGDLAAVTPALSKLKAAFAGEKMNDSDGVRIDFADGWVHLRASNTEPIARIIAEAPTAARAQELIAMCAKAAGL